MGSSTKGMRSPREVLNSSSIYCDESLDWFFEISWIRSTCSGRAVGRRAGPSAGLPCVGIPLCPGCVSMIYRRSLCWPERRSSPPSVLLWAPRYAAGPIKRSRVRIPLSTGFGRLSHHRSGSGVVRGDFPDLYSRIRFRNLFLNCRSRSLGNRMTNQPGNPMSYTLPLTVTR